VGDRNKWKYINPGLKKVLSPSLLDFSSHSDEQSDLIGGK
jgi:hypothetical protein